MSFLLHFFCKQKREKQSIIFDIFFNQLFFALSFGITHIYPRDLTYDLLTSFFLLQKQRCHIFFIYARMKINLFSLYFVFPLPQLPSHPPFFLLQRLLLLLFMACVCREEMSIIISNLKISSATIFMETFFATIFWTIHF